MTNATLHEYLNIDSSVRFIRDKLNTEFFLESNLFDLCVMGKIKPIIYNTGGIWITPVKEQSYCPDDFDDINSTNFLDFEFSQLTEFIGYCYILHTGKDEIGFDDMKPRHTTILQKVIASNPILNTNKIGGFNKCYGTYLATLPKNGNHAFFAKTFDTKDLMELQEKMNRCQGDYDQYFKLGDKRHELIYKYINIQKSDLKFHIDDLLELIDSEMAYLIEDIDRTKQLLKDIDTTLNNHAQEIQSKNNEIIALQARIAELESQLATPTNKTELPARTANNASKIILAMAECLGWDLSKPFADETNGKIREILEKQGNALSKDTVGQWLKQAYDIGK